MTANSLDDLSQRIIRSVKDLSLVLDNQSAVADEERAAVARVIAVTQTWGLDDRHRRTRPLL